MYSYFHQRRKQILFLTSASLFVSFQLLIGFIFNDFHYFCVWFQFIGLGIFLAGLKSQPTEVLKFLHEELGSIFVIPNHILAFGFLSMTVSINGIFNVWANDTFYFRVSKNFIFRISTSLLSAKILR